MDATDPDGPIEKPGQDAHQAVSPQVARAVLVWGPVVVVIVFAIIWYVQRP